MKRKAKIEVEIDCDKEFCGKCRKVHDASWECYQFEKTLDLAEYNQFGKNSYKRCQECLNKFK